MIALQPVVDRMTERGFKRVEGIVEYSALTERPPILPAYFVVPERKSAGPSALTQGIDQLVTCNFAIVIVIAGQARRAGQPSDALKSEIDAVDDALVGWTHPAASRPTQLVSGDLLRADNSVIAWRELFVTAYHHRRI